MCRERRSISRHRVYLWRARHTLLGATGSERPDVTFPAWGMADGPVLPLSPSVFGWESDVGRAHVRWVRSG